MKDLRTSKDWIAALWPAPPNVRALTTTRSGGVSRGRHQGLNLGVHSGDIAEAVAENRSRLKKLTLGADGKLQWLTQVHGNRCIRADARSCRTAPEADACWTTRAGIGLAIQTADCVPIVLARCDGSAVGAAHGGWRGLVGGVVASLVEAMQSGRAADGAGGSRSRQTTERCASASLRAWIGPAIGPAAYEVGEDVHSAVAQATGPGAVAAFFSPGNRPGKWHLDLFTLTEWLLRRAGVAEIHCPRLCTWSDQRFYSYRRDGRTGRMATLVWMLPR